MSLFDSPSLFSFEVAVDKLFIRRAVICHVPVVAFRLLDYPTIAVSLISDYNLKVLKSEAKSNPQALDNTYQLTQLQHSSGTFIFNKGKSCLLKKKASDLQANLASTPLYLMLMDILPDVPKLVASCSVSLDSIMKRIVRDISVNGTEVPSSHGETDLFPLYNLMGSKVGEVNLGVRLISLGISMLQHVSGISEPGERSALDEKILSPETRKTKAKFDTLTNSDALTCSDKIPGKKIAKKVLVSKDDDKENKTSVEKPLGDKITKISKPSTATQASVNNSRCTGLQFPLSPIRGVTGSSENVYCPPALFYNKNSDPSPKLQSAIVATAHADSRHIEFANFSEELNESVPSAYDRILEPQPMTMKNYSKEHAATQYTQTENARAGEESGFPSSLAEFPILRALMEEVSKLGLKQERSFIESKTDTKKAPPKSEVGRPQSGNRASLKRSGKFSLGQKQPEPKQPLRFGMTNTMRMRIAMSRAERAKREEETAMHARLTPTGPQILGQTFTKSSREPRRRRTRMVTKACGPDESMYRSLGRSTFPHNIQAQTVFLGDVAGHEEATDVDVPSLPHVTPESQYEYLKAQANENKDDDLNIDDLVIIKEMGTPRAGSRQSQRSIEIRLPTASTDFQSEGEWDSTFSDRENLVELLRVNKTILTEKEETRTETQPGFYTPARSSETCKSQESDERSEKSRSRDEDVHKSSDISASDRYKYSDDFEDDKTWSANRTPSVTSSKIILEQDEEDESKKKEDAGLPVKSMDSTVTTTHTSDFTDSSEHPVIKQIDELQSASKQKISTSDDGLDSSSLSKGTSSVVTALMTASKSGKTKSKTASKKLKVGNLSVPIPVPSDSPVIQSMNTESSTSQSFPDPHIKHGLVSKSPRAKKKTASKEIHFPETSKPDKASKSVKTKSDRGGGMTPSPPSTRKYSPISSPDSSRERINRIFRHPGRHTRPSSSGSITDYSEVDKGKTSVKRSDSVSSYQPSDFSDMSNIKLSDNLSDILSEDDSSQMSGYSARLSPDSPKQLFIKKPQLDPSARLGYTT